MGKSTLIRKLGNEKYERFVEINLALNDAAREAFAEVGDCVADQKPVEGYLHDAIGNDTHDTKGLRMALPSL